jgi:hypothetical protein
MATDDFCDGYSSISHISYVGERVFNLKFELGRPFYYHPTKGKGQVSGGTAQIHALEQPHFQKWTFIPITFW